MRIPERRTSALLGLAGVVLLVAGVQILPLAMPSIACNREWFKRVRANLSGAYFLGESGMVLQERGNDCGAACLTMILSAHGIECSLAALTNELSITSEGTSMLSLRLAAAAHGLPARSWTIRSEDLPLVPFPVIAFIHGNHFVVIRRFAAPHILEVDDPALGKLEWPVHSFEEIWEGETLVFDPGWVPL